MHRLKAKLTDRAGTIDWKMEGVTALAGKWVPIELLGQVKGTNRRKAFFAAVIVTGALVFPYSPEAGLIWALKKDDEAVLYESRN